MDKKPIKIKLIDVRQEEMTPDELSDSNIDFATDFVWLDGVVQTGKNKYKIRKLISEKAFSQVIKRGAYLGYLTPATDCYLEHQVQLAKERNKKNKHLKEDKELIKAKKIDKIKNKLAKIDQSYANLIRHFANN